MKTETVSSAKRPAIIEASFSHPFPLFLSSLLRHHLFLSLSLCLSRTRPRFYSSRLDEGIHVKPCRRVGKLAVTYAMRACRWMVHPPSNPLPKSPKRVHGVERSALYRPSRMSKRLKDPRAPLFVVSSPRGRHLCTSAVCTPPARDPPTK